MKHLYTYQKVTGSPTGVPAAATPQSVRSQTPKLLDQFLAAALHYGHTEAWAAEAADWCRQFILFHGKRHPSEMGLAEIGRIDGPAGFASRFE